MPPKKYSFLKDGDVRGQKIDYQELIFRHLERVNFILPQVYMKQRESIKHFEHMIKGLEVNIYPVWMNDKEYIEEKAKIEVEFKRFKDDKLLYLSSQAGYRDEYVDLLFRWWMALMRALQKKNMLLQKRTTAVL